MFYLPNMHSKVSINVVSVDVNVIPRYSKPLMHVHKVQITNLDDLNVGKKHWNCDLLYKRVIVTFVFGSVITSNVVGAILPWCYNNLENILQNEFSKS